MDPLSVSASVAGLIAATAKVGSLLFGMKDTPRLVQTGLSEVRAIGIVLWHLQSLIIDNNAPTVGKSALPIEHLTILLTDCVVVFSELESMIEEIGGGTGIINRAKWARKQGDAVNLIQRLQNQKLTLSLMIDVLQW
jgi:hypothetical protein